MTSADINISRFQDSRKMGFKRRQVDQGFSLFFANIIVVQLRNIIKKIAKIEEVFLAKSQRSDFGYLFRH